MKRERPKSGRDLIGKSIATAPGSFLLVRYSSTFCRKNTTQAARVQLAAIRPVCSPKPPACPVPAIAGVAEVIEAQLILALAFQSAQFQIIQKFRRWFDTRHK